MVRLLSKDWKEHVEGLNANELLGDVKGKNPNICMSKYSQTDMPF